TITSNGYEQINSYHYTNKTGKVESAHKTPTLNHDVTRKLSLTKGQEFSFGQEISIESGKLSELVAKMSAKATAGQKFTSSTTEETLITDKVTYGGNTYELDPGDTIDVIYRIQNTRTNGTLKTASQIDFNLDGRYGLRYLTQEELDYANKEHSLPTSTNRYTGSSPSLAHFFGVLLGYPGVVKPGAVAVALDYYDVYDGNTGRHKNDAYVMNLNTLKKAFTIDGNNDRSKVYLNQTTADFTLDDQSVNIIVDVSITNPKTSKNKTYSNIVENPIITQ
ncbi:hypothetical protein P4325_32920, partial [Bacillus thuringiensis]|nr:hypothetical protein [Bacillus thuringiensis]